MGRMNEAMRRVAAGVRGTQATTDGPVHGVEDAAVLRLDLDRLVDGVEPATAHRRPEPDSPPGVASGSAATATPAVRPASEGRTAVSGGSLLEQISSEAAEKVVVDDRILPASREQYRRLAAGLHRAQEASGVKVVMIASAAAGEGKTLTACNLALTLSESYERRVLLIDADLRRPTLHQVFRINSPEGLADGLASETDRKLPLHAVSPRLTVLPAGTSNSDPMASLTSARMRKVLEEARTAFDWVIVDTPPVGLMTDANLLAAMVDGTVLVVKAGSTPYDLVQRVAASLRESGQVLGVVLNRATVFNARHGYGYGYGYGRGYDTYGDRHAATADGADPS